MSRAKQKQNLISLEIESGGSDGTRTRNIHRDRVAL